MGGATQGRPVYSITLWGISIHAPRGGSDSTVGQYTGLKDKFQSTLPVGGATAVARDCLFYAMISIHAPRGGSDTFNIQTMLNDN